MPSCAAGVRLLSFLGSKRFLWRVSPKRNTATPKRGFWIWTWKARSFWVWNGSMVRSCSVFLKLWPIPGMPVPHGSRWTSSQPSFHCAPTFRTTPWTVWHASPGMCSPAWESRKASWVSWMILDDWWEVGPPDFFGVPKNIRVPTPYTWNILKSFSQMIHWTSLNYRLGWWLCGLGPRNAPIMDPSTPGTALIPLLSRVAKLGSYLNDGQFCGTPQKHSIRLGIWWPEIVDGIIPILTDLSIQVFYYILLPSHYHPLLVSNSTVSS